MRSLFAFLLACTLAVPALADVSFVRVWGSYRTADSFVRISEYFTGHEVTARNETLLRTQPTQRGGYYFLARVKNTGAEIANAKIELHLITARSPQPESHIFSAVVPHGQHVYQIGLTGTDWPHLDEQPVAWKVDVIGADGQILTSQQSFLWSKPDRS